LRTTARSEADCRSTTAASIGWRVLYHALNRADTWLPIVLTLVLPPPRQSPILSRRDFILPRATSRIAHAASLFRVAFVPRLVLTSTLRLLRSLIDNLPVWLAPIISIAAKAYFARPAPVASSHGRSSTPDEFRLTGRGFCRTPEAKSNQFRPTITREPVAGERLAPT
jgi:hypothetical protein